MILIIILITSNVLLKIYTLKLDMRIFYRLFFLSILTIAFACSSDNDGFPEEGEEAEEISPVVFDIDAVPYPKLSDYNFFKSPLSDMNPVYGVIPYEPISSLFTDYAIKKRFLWMPEGVSANYTADDEIINFPSGAVLIKSFYYNNVLPGNTTRILETRLMIKKDNEWLFANYKWNEEQSEAFLDLEGSFVPVEWNQNGETKSVNYRIPSHAECLTCHKTNDNAIPIGPKPQNLNFNILFAEGSMNQLEKWEEFGYLNPGFPANINTMVNYNDASEPLEMRVRSYLDINCAHCHNENGHCNYLPIKLSYSETEDPSNMGVCVVPNIDISGMVGETVTHIVVPGSPEKSTMYHRINTEMENIRMPMLGRNLIHTEGVSLVTQWINSLEGECN